MVAHSFSHTHERFHYFNTNWILIRSFPYADVNSVHIRLPLLFRFDYCIRRVSWQNFVNTFRGLANCCTGLFTQGAPWTFFGMLYRVLYKLYDRHCHMRTTIILKSFSQWTSVRFASFTKLASIESLLTINNENLS